MPFIPERKIVYTSPQVSILEKLNELEQLLQQAYGLDHKGNRVHLRGGADTAERIDSKINQIRSLIKGL